ncbi:MAG: hypothetical protein N4A47_01360 [Clostridia bacterium]|jgi:hypothetical protein|nr:hypothetical protein [Clostridia bacterium]
MDKVLVLNNAIVTKPVLEKYAKAMKKKFGITELVLFSKWPKYISTNVFIEEGIKLHLIKDPEDDKNYKNCEPKEYVIETYGEGKISLQMAHNKSDLKDIKNSINVHAETDRYICETDMDNRKVEVSPGSFLNRLSSTLIEIDDEANVMVDKVIYSNSTSGLSKGIIVKDSRVTMPSEDLCYETDDKEYIKISSEHEYTKFEKEKIDSLCEKL